jgi:GT2 family glycosyltransferase
MVRAFGAFPEVAGLNGVLLADGIHGPGISAADAEGMVDARDRGPPLGRPSLVAAPLVGLYGCNMVFRRSAIEGLWFDEALPLYGWQEDVDFAARAGRAGLMAKTDAFYGVHRGVKRGRTSGLRMGYSQVVNPVYLARKGSLPWSFSLRLIARNMAANLARSVRPEPWIDRRGRLAGNARALADLVRGRVEPGRILEM